MNHWPENGKWSAPFSDLPKGGAIAVSEQLVLLTIVQSVTLYEGLLPISYFKHIKILELVALNQRKFITWSYCSLLARIVYSRMPKLHPFLYNDLVSQKCQVMECRMCISCVCKCRTVHLLWLTVWRCIILY